MMIKLNKIIVQLMTSIQNWSIMRWVCIGLLYILIFPVCEIVNVQLQYISVDGHLLSVYNFLSESVIASWTFATLATCLVLHHIYTYDYHKYISLPRVALLVFAITIVEQIDTLNSVVLFGCFDYRKLTIFLLFLMLVATLLPGCMRKIKKKRKEKKESQRGVFSVSTTKGNQLDDERDEFANNLVRRIQMEIASEESFAIGIIGMWGEGKTEMLEMLKKRLGNEYNFEFNPWQNSGNITQNFISELNTFLNDQIPVGNTFVEYAKLLKESNVEPITSLLSSLYLKNKRFSIAGQVKRINECLDRLGKNIYVFIDDIDRLDSNEVLEVAKLVRNTAAFHHLIYIVTYDCSYLTAMLKSAGISQTEMYLKKIFPLQVSLPKLPYGFLPKFLDSELTDFLVNDTSNRVPELMTEIYAIGNDGKFKIEHYLHNMRGVKNFAMSLSFSFEMLAKRKEWISEYNLHDLFWLEMLRFADQELYNQIRYGQIDIFKDNNPDTKFYSLNKEKDDYKRLSVKQRMLIAELFEGIDRYANRFASLYDHSKYLQIHISKQDLTKADFTLLLKGEINIKEYFKQRRENGTFPGNSLTYMMTVISMDNKLLDDENRRRYIDILIEWAKTEWRKSLFCNIVNSKMLYENEKMMSHLISRLNEWGQEEEDKPASQQDTSVYFKIQCLIREVSQRLGEIERSKGDTFKYKDNLEKLIDANFKRFISFIPAHSAEGLIGARGLAFLQNSTIEQVYLSEDDDSLNHVCHHSLIIDKVIEYFSQSPSKKYEPMFNKFAYTQPPYIDDPGYDIQQEIEDRENACHFEIAKTFGTLVQYKEFLEKCFVIPQDVLTAYYSKIHI